MSSCASGTTAGPSRRATHKKPTSPASVIGSRSSRWSWRRQKEKRMNNELPLDIMNLQLNLLSTLANHLRDSLKAETFLMSFVRSFESVPTARIEVRWCGGLSAVIDLHATWTTPSSTSLPQGNSGKKS